MLQCGIMRAHRKDNFLLGDQRKILFPDSTIWKIGLDSLQFSWNPKLLWFRGLSSLYTSTLRLLCTKRLDYLMLKVSWKFWRYFLNNSPSWHMYITSSPAYFLLHIHAYTWEIWQFLLPLIMLIGMWQTIVWE